MLTKIHMLPPIMLPREVIQLNQSASPCPNFEGELLCHCNNAKLYQKKILKLSKLTGEDFNFQNMV